MQLIPERLRGELLTTTVGLVVVLLVAGLTHFIAILLLPKVASKDAYTLLQSRGRTNHMVLFAASRPGDATIPFRDPATVQGLCFFDVGETPVRVRTTTEEGRMLTLSFRTPEGRIFYSMSDRAALRNTIDIRLVTAAQLEAIEDGEDDDSGLPSELRLKAPTRRGLVVATALVTRPSDVQDAVARIKAITCAPEPLPPPQG